MEKLNIERKSPKKNLKKMKKKSTVIRNIANLEVF